MDLFARSGGRSEHSPIVMRGLDLARITPGAMNFLPRTAPLEGDTQAAAHRPKMGTYGPTRQRAAFASVRIDQRSPFGLPAISSSFQAPSSSTNS